MLCQYKHVLGIPSVGFHSIRLLDVAAGDYFGTILLSILFSKFSHVPLVISTI